MQTFDQYFVKYSASVVAMLVYAAPLWSEAPGSHGSRDDITQNYIRAMRLLQNTSRCAQKFSHMEIIYTSRHHQDIGTLYLEFEPS